MKHPSGVLLGWKEANSHMASGCWSCGKSSWDNREKRGSLSSTATKKWILPTTCDWEKDPGLRWDPSSGWHPVVSPVRTWAENTAAPHRGSEIMNVGFFFFSFFFLSHWICDDFLHNGSTQIHPEGIPGKDEWIRCDIPWIYFYHILVHFLLPICFLCRFAFFLHL